METILELLSTGSAHRSARRLNQAARANNRLFREAMREVPEKRYPEIVQAAWAGYRDGDTAFIGNRVVFFAKLPRVLVRQFVAAAPDGAIEAWALAGVPSHALRILWTSYISSFQDSNGSPARLRMLSTLETIARCAAPNRIANFPFIVKIMRVPVSSGFSRILHAVLVERAVNVLEHEHEMEHSAVRLLVDTLQFGPPRAGAAEAVRRVVAETVGACSMYDQALLVGILRTLEEADPLGLPPVLLGAHSDRGELSDWVERASTVEAALAAIGCTDGALGSSIAIPKAIAAKAAGISQEEVRSPFMERIQEQIDALGLFAAPAPARAAVTPRSFTGRDVE